MRRDGQQRYSPFAFATAVRRGCEAARCDEADEINYSQHSPALSLSLSVSRFLSSSTAALCLRVVRVGLGYLFAARPFDSSVLCSSLTPVLKFEVFSFCFFLYLLSSFFFFLEGLAFSFQFCLIRFRFRFVRSRRERSEQNTHTHEAHERAISMRISVKFERVRCAEPKHNGWTGAERKNQQTQPTNHSPSSAIDRDR